MDSIAQALDRADEALQWFGNVPEVRVLHLTTSGAIRLPVLQQVAAAEERSPSPVPYFILEAPTEAGDDGWELRRQELRADYEDLRTQLAEEGLEVPELPAGEPAPSSHALLSFQRDVIQICRSMPPPLEGAVVVLAPVWVRDPDRWKADLKALLIPKLLKRVRFVVVDLESPVAAEVVAALGQAAEAWDCRPDEAAMQRDMDALIAGMASAPAGSGGARLTGAAGPSVATPPRKKAPRALEPAALAAVAQETGVPAALLTPEVPGRLRLLVMQAAQAIRKGNTAEGVERQREARDLALEMGLVREGVVLELVMASFLLQGGAPRRATELYIHARKRADEHGLVELSVQAQLAYASTLLVDQRPLEAATVYAKAGQHAARHGKTALAIEGYRLSGQLLADANQPKRAVKAWRKALDVAEEAPTDERRASTAVEVARALAAVCRRFGLKEQAASLDAQAASFEAEAAQPPARDAADAG